MSLFLGFDFGVLTRDDGAIEVALAVDGVQRSSTLGVMGHVNETYVERLKHESVPLARRQSPHIHLSEIPDLLM